MDDKILEEYKKLVEQLIALFKECIDTTFFFDENNIEGKIQEQENLVKRLFEVDNILKEKNIALTKKLEKQVHLLQKLSKQWIARLCFYQGMIAKQQEGMLVAKRRLVQLRSAYVKPIIQKEGRRRLMTSGKVDTLS